MLLELDLQWARNFLQFFYFVLSISLTNIDTVCTGVPLISAGSFQSLSCLCYTQGNILNITN